jgi:hypothetical protein
VSTGYTADAPFTASARSALTDSDRAIVDLAEQALSDGLELKRWWERADADGDYDARFGLVREFNPSDISYAFFGRAPVRGRSVPVMGTVDGAFYDRAKTIPGRRDAEFREFVLRYLLRVSAFRLPEVFIADPRRTIQTPLRRLGLCQEPEPRQTGFGYTQLYFKSSATGEIGKFQGAKQQEIVDLREIGPKYRWIVLKVRIFNFDLSVRPLGYPSPTVAFTLDESSYLVINADLVTDRQRPAPGILGEYGLGYVFLKNPVNEGQLTYGPGNFDVAFQLIDFRLLDGGEIRSRLVFAANRPNQIVDVTFDPVHWGIVFADLMTLGLTSRILFPDGPPGPSQRVWRTGFDPIRSGIALANLVTGGLAARQFCVSMKELERRFLVQHYMQHYEMLTGSILTWRQIPNWLDEANLPRWVLTGTSA